MSDDEGGLYNPDGWGCPLSVAAFLAVVAALLAGVWLA